MQNAAIPLSAVDREVFADLCELLPPPVSDTQEARDTREAAAMAAMAALHPADAFEALLAVQIVAADAHARECLRLAVKASREPEVARRHRAQALTMMRQVQSGLRTLESRQARREQADAEMQPATMAHAGYSFRETVASADAPSPQVEAPELAVAAEAERYVAIYPEKAEVAPPGPESLHPPLRDDISRQRDR